LVYHVKSKDNESSEIPSKPFWNTTRNFVG
jgi:hypothetical protein